MARIDPSDGKKTERDPEEGNIPTGLYLCELSRVEEVGPSAKFPNGNNRLVFEFTVSEGPCKGKNAVVFLGKTLHKSKEGKESNLVKWARMMGVASPEKGFDPDTLLGKRFNVMVEYTAGIGGEAGRGWARQAILATPPSPAENTTAKPALPQQSSGGPTAADPSARWDARDESGSTLANKSSAEVQAIINEAKCEANRLRVKPAGAPVTAARPASEYGFINGDPIPW